MTGTGSRLSARHVSLSGKHTRAFSEVRSGEEEIGSPLPVREVAPAPGVEGGAASVTVASLVAPAATGCSMRGGRCSSSPRQRHLWSYPVGGGEYD
jgi:hypothetical protein